MSAIQELFGRRTDSWGNPVTNVGIEGKDKSAGFGFYRSIGSLQSPGQLAEFYRSDWAVGAIVDEVPDACFRRGWSLRSSEPPEVKTRIDEAIALLGVQAKVIQALKLERLYGGATILLCTGKNDDYRSPLPERIETLEALNVFEAQELSPVQLYGNPFAAHFGQVALYRLTPVIPTNGRTQELIHASRLVIFPGLEVSKQIRYSADSWGESVVSRVYDSIRQLSGALAATAATLADANQKVYAIKGLLDLLQAPDREAQLQTRIDTINKIRSVVNALVMDAEHESITNLATPLTEFANILDRYMLAQAAAFRMPSTVMMRQSPAGLNATGESDLTIWNDVIRAEQRDNVTPKLEQILRVLFASARGPTAGKDPEDWSVYFPPLDSPTETEMAEVRSKQADTDTKYQDMGVKASTILKARFGGPEYSTELQLTADDISEIEDLEEIEANEPEPDPAMMASMVPPNGKPQPKPPSPPAQA